MNALEKQYQFPFNERNFELLRKAYMVHDQILRVILSGHEYSEEEKALIVQASDLSDRIEKELRS